MSDDRCSVVTAIMHFEKLIWNGREFLYIQGPNDPPFIEIKFKNAPEQCARCLRPVNVEWHKTGFFCKDCIGELRQG